jgi:CheY-like chemotaxis protein
MAQQNVPTSPHKRVLVVDDNREAADVLTEMLALCGYEAVPAYDGPSALQAAERLGPDAVILDIGMPGMSGLAVAAALRGQPRFAATRVVAFTAWGDKRTREQTRQAGFDAHLVKPAGLDAILAALSDGAAMHAA